ncbi:OmpA family protein [Spirillospora sp. CA-253888]
MDGVSHARIEVQHVERYADRSVLRFHMTNLQKVWDNFAFANTVGGMAGHTLQFDLLDPVGRKLYHPLWDNGGKGRQVGSITKTRADPGVRLEMQLHFPPLPKEVRTVTLMTTSTAGEFNGVPVVEGKGSPTPRAPVLPEGIASPGTHYALPVRRQEGEAPPWIDDLHGLAEGEVKSTSTTREEQRIGLRADVLFDFDKATLTPRAKEVLDDVAAQTKAEADPSKPPIIITGHTDGKGTPAYNRPLSQQRADAVLAELRARLGTAYQYKAEGKGETRPVAKEGGPDDEKARARNRRVEISYQIKQEQTQTTTSTTKGPVTPAGAAAPPAAFRPDDGPTVASRTVESEGWNQKRKRRIDVKPFYRDGAYLVAVFEITNLGPESDSLSQSPYSDLGVGAFGAFSVLDPASKITYKGVSVGPPTDDKGVVNNTRLDAGFATFLTEPNTTNRGFFYVPAPPPSTTKVTFNAGPFDHFTDVPIR